MAKWSLTLVWWVIFVCLAQNAGVFNVCAFKNAALQKTNAGSLVITTDTTASFSSVADAKQGNQEIAEGCDLTEKLLSFHQHSLDDYGLYYVVLAMVVLLWLLTLLVGFNPFTEPILPKRRRHLQFCVFRE